LKLNSTIYNCICSRKGQIAILIDPDKFDWDNSEELLKKIKVSKADYLFVGGSTVSKPDLLKVVSFFKKKLDMPVVLFPGDVDQVSENADALLYLSLLSGRNPDYLIGQHTRTAKEVYDMDLEIIPTAYLLIDGGNASAVAYVSQTTAMPQNQVNLIERTAIAGILQGKGLIYLDAGSGAKNKVSTEIISVCAKLNVPVIVGGGIRTISDLKTAKDSGANVVVIGNHIEENIDFLLDIAQFQNSKLH
jgi:putative glycerol-1-phosphate prenyltransferase